MVSRKRRRTKKRRMAAAGAGMHWGVFGEATGAKGESVLAEGDCADVATASGKRVTWETLNLTLPCLFLLLHISRFPLVLPNPTFSITHISLFHTNVTQPTLPLQSL